MIASAMPTDFWVRLAIAVVLGIGSVLLYRLVNRAILARAQQQVRTGQHPLPVALRGDAAIVYFTTPHCAPCKTVQRPALQQLQQNWPYPLQIIEINAEEHPDMAQQWGVLSVPTTFLLDAQGNLRHVNHGVTRVEKLMQQVNHL